MASSSAATSANSLVLALNSRSRRTLSIQTHSRTLADHTSAPGMPKKVCAY